MKKHNVPIGYSGHDRGIISTLSAVAKGACIIERHITLDKNMEGPDHAASLDIDEFELFMRNLRELEVSLGSNNDRIISQGEMSMVVFFLIGRSHTHFQQLSIFHHVATASM